MFPVLYSSPTCAPCREVKKWLQANNIPYTEKGVEEAIKDGFSSVPILVHRGQTYKGPTVQQLREIFPE
jgi:glutaredoxin